MVETNKPRRRKLVEVETNEEVMQRINKERRLDWLYHFLRLGEMEAAYAAQIVALQSTNLTYIKESSKYYQKKYKRLREEEL
jgi:hypothetical protein